MKTIGIGITLALLTTAAVAQQPAAPATKTYTSSAEITALIAKAKSERKENQALVAQPILRLAPYNNASLEYRASVGPAAVHEKEAEYFYVVDGSATLVTGGKLVGETRNGDNHSPLVQPDQRDYCAHVAARGAACTSGRQINRQETK
jgi:mannose-6-phosphate isomerase-like protein (cupin superfamily)